MEDSFAALTMQAPAVPPDSALAFRVLLSTRWSDEDNQGVLNNAVHATLLEEARHAYFTRLGLMRERRFPFVLLQTNLRFLAPGTGAEDVEVALSTVHLGTTSFLQAYRIRACHSAIVWCEAEALLVAWDPEQRGSRHMDAAFRSAIQAFEPGL